MPQSSSTESRQHSLSAVWDEHMTSVKQCKPVDDISRATSRLFPRRPITDAAAVSSTTRVEPSRDMNKP